MTDQEQADILREELKYIDEQLQMIVRRLIYLSKTIYHLEKENKQS